MKNLTTHYNPFHQGVDYKERTYNLEANVALVMLKVLQFCSANFCNTVHFQTYLLKNAYCTLTIILYK